MSHWDILGPVILQSVRSCFYELFLHIKWTNRYKIKEYRRHGEAASANPMMVETEQKRMREVLARFAKKDRWNFDELSLFAFAPPDRRLATHQMSGKKRSKFCITLGFTCNANGSEKMPVLFIGKSKWPRCFKAMSPAQHGFYYRHNKKAWMTKEIFEECVRLFFMFQYL